jgi:hypothetical protein
MKKNSVLTNSHSNETQNKHFESHEWRPGNRLRNKSKFKIKYQNFSKMDLFNKLFTPRSNKTDEFCLPLNKTDKFCSFLSLKEGVV